MAEAATPTVQTPVPDRTESPANSVDASIAHLEETMQVAMTAANAQRDLEAQGIDPESAAEPEPSGTSDTDEAELVDDAEPTSDQEAEPSTPEPKRYSRKDAQRLDEQLQEAQRELNALRSQTSYYGSRDEQVMRQLAQLTGADHTDHQQSTYGRLSTKVLNGTASDDERQKVREMTEWRSAVGPIYEAANKQVWEAFSRDFGELKKLDGVTEPVYQELLKVPNPARLIHRVYELGLTAGKKQAASESKRLEASNTALRTKATADKAQPVPGTNGATPKPSSIREQMFRRGTDGRMELNPDFERKAERGELLGVDLTR